VDQRTQAVEEDSDVERRLGPVERDQITLPEKRITQTSLDRSEHSGMFAMSQNQTGRSSVFHMDGVGKSAPEGT
jgi:hypothetical protein